MGGRDEAPVGHTASRRNRASTRCAATSARIRINTTPAKNSVAPASVQNSGHRIAESIVEPVSPMLCPWCSVFHQRSEEHTSELQSLMRISYAVFFLKKKHN